jgi:hypothetical protein
MKRLLYFVIPTIILGLSIPPSVPGYAATSGQNSVLELQDKLSDSSCLITCLKSFREIAKCNTSKMISDQITEDKDSPGKLKKAISRLFKRN